MTDRYWQVKDILKKSAHTTIGYCYRNKVETGLWNKSIEYNIIKKFNNIKKKRLLTIPKK